MPGYLFHFCAEWQKARKVLQLDSEALYDLAACIVEDTGELCKDSIWAQQLGIAGWRLDVPAATDAGILVKKKDFKASDVNDEIGPSFTVGPNLIMRANSPKSPPGSPRGKGTLLGRLNTSQNLSQSISKNISKNLSGGPSKSINEHLYSNSANAPPVLREPVLFRNPSHPISGLPFELTRDEFVQEVRRRLITEPLFTMGPQHKESAKEPVMSIEDSEDLFEALVLLQGGGDSLTLHTGRQLDVACDKFFALSRLRQLMERGATSLSAFFNMLDLGGRKGLEPNELKHFLKNVGSDFLSSMAAALAVEGVDVNILATTLFKAMDANKDGKVELWEMKRQLSLAAPPRVSMVEVVGHFEVKVGYGRSALGEAKSRSQLFDHLCRKESLDVSPEDVVRCFRAVSGGDKSRTVSPSEFDAFLKGMPLEVSWGVEPHAADRLYCALGARMLQLERNNRMDACLPADGLLYECPMEAAPSTAQEESDTRARFERIWERCVKNAPDFAGSAGKQLHDSCFRRLVEAMDVLKERQRQVSPPQLQGLPPQPPLASSASKPTSGNLPALPRAAGRGTTLPRSLFPNISDVLVTASTQLHVGQACVVRYRLTGTANFWGSGHEVLMNDRETIQWPCPRKLLGETPFIALVPCGLSWSSGGGGGFYAGSQPFTSVDPNLRADLPRDSASGYSSLFGTVEIIPPSLVRTARTGFDGLSQDFELRLFCATKNKITACIGDPLKVTVVHQVRPPPMASLQVRCEGRSAVLRWSALDLGAHARRTGVESVRLHMKSAQTERCFSLDADASKWDVQDLTPDTEYEFRVRRENRAGPGREAVAVIRTNSICAAPATMSCAESKTSHVDLKWARPQTIGNERTHDRFQQNRETIECFEASLTTEDDEKDDRRAANEVGGDDIMDELAALAPATANSAARKCRWLAGSWKEMQGGDIIGRLDGLRPDTRYALEGFCALTSMGKGISYKTLIFWTVPQVPRIASLRVKNGQVLVALAQTGGVCVKDFQIVVSLTEKPREKMSFDHSMSNLRADHAGDSTHPELTLPFKSMPFAESKKTHSLTIRASNLGGWSDWSTAFEDQSWGGGGAISKQQSSESRLLALIKAMEERSIDDLTRLLKEVKDIQFKDTSHVEKATVMLEKLVSARSELAKTAQVRDPGPLLQALKVARKVQLPDINKAEGLLRKLDGVVHNLEIAPSPEHCPQAKGIELLRVALKAAHEARLPPHLLSAPSQRLSTREAAEQALIEAMEAARVPGLAAALEISVGMNLPSEQKGYRLLSALQHSESLLNEAIEKRLIVDLVFALRSAEQNGLREDGLTESARTLLSELKAKQEFHRSHIDASMDARHPVQLKATIDAAQDAQVLDKDMQLARSLLQYLQGIVRMSEVAIGVHERQKALDVAHDANLPSTVLAPFEDQLKKLIAVFSAVARGSVEILRKQIKSADQVNVKLVEVAEAKVVYADWHKANHEVEVSMSLGQQQRLHDAIRAAEVLGINKDQFESARAVCKAVKKRNHALKHLKHAMDNRNCEKLQETLKAACDLELHDTVMMQEAHRLVHWLSQMRLEVAAATDSNDLRRIYETLAKASAAPSLPDSELRKCRGLLTGLQDTESDEIHSELSQAHSNSKWRLLDDLALRANRVAAWGVEIEPNEINRAEQEALYMSEVEREGFEVAMMDERLKRDWARWIHQVPEQGDSISLPTGTVNGEFTLYFKAGGTYLATLPREIVEGKLIVPLEETDMAIIDFEKTNVIVSQLLKGLERLISVEDDIQRVCKRIFDDGGRHRRRGSEIIDGHLEISFAVYVRAAHNASEIAEALVERGHLGGDLWQSEAGTFLVEPPKANSGTEPEKHKHHHHRHSRHHTHDEANHHHHNTRSLAEPDADLAGADHNHHHHHHHHHHNHHHHPKQCARAHYERPGGPLIPESPSVVAAEIAATLSRSITQRSMGGKTWTQGPQRVRRLCDFVAGVRPRVLRRVTVELGWRYDRGLMDSLDATCLAFDEERLVEIIDHRGYHGFRYGAGTGSGKGQSCPDATVGAVRHGGDVMDDEHRNGKQVMHVRLDLMPKRITDLIFVLSAYNSRDLNKFSDLNAAIFDTDSGTELASAKVPAAGAEAQIMCSLYRLSDGLWRVNSLMAPCKGTARDYRPVLARLLELGYPRNVSMRDQVAHLFNGMQEDLKLDRAVKAAGVTVGADNTMAVPYTMELFGNSLRGHELVKEISDKHYHQDVLLESLANAPGGDRFSEKHIAVDHPSTKDFRNARLELQWNYPSLPPAKHTPIDSVPPQEENFLDATCIVFEGQALREIVDYRGPHGVRIVHNGVVDYGGMWLGKVNIGDATGGGVWHAGMEMDNASRAGKQFMEARLDLLPRAATDLFFALSAPVNRDISRYSEVQTRLVDGSNPGHEVASVPWNQKSVDEKKVGGQKSVDEKKVGGPKPVDEPWEAVVLCSLSRAADGDPSWQLISFGCLTQGNATDYRPMILCLRAIQANRCARPSPWPHQAPLEEEVKVEREARDRQALMLLDIPLPVVLKKRGGSDSDSTGSSNSSLGAEDTEEGNRKSEVWQAGQAAPTSLASLQKVAGLAGAALRFRLAVGRMGKRSSSLTGTEDTNATQATLTELAGQRKNQRSSTDDGQMHQNNRNSIQEESDSSSSSSSSSGSGLSSQA